MTTYARSSWRMWCRQCRAFSARHVRAALRDRSALFWSFLWPVLWYFLTVHLLVLPAVPAALTSAETSAVKAMQALSFGLFGAVSVTLVGFAGEFTRDIEDRRYRQFRALPLAPTADLAGRFLGGFALGTLSFLVVLGASLVDGASYTPTVIGLALTAVTLAAICGICMAIAVGFAAAFRTRATTTLATLSVVLLAFFASGFNGTYPAMLPDRWRWVAGVAPNALATRFHVAALLDIDWAQAGLSPPAQPTGGGLALLAVIAGCCCLFATVVVRRFVYRGGGRV
ncbi:ABC transporter permease [Haloferacaceae archaeon DSL9]